MNAATWTPLVGVVLGSALTYGGQALADRRSARRDVARALNEARIRRETDWLLLQRETLAQLQDAMDRLWSLKMLEANGLPTMAQAEEQVLSVGRVTLLASRLEDQELGRDIGRWTGSILAMSAQDSISPMVNERTRLQERVGQALRALHPR